MTLLRVPSKRQTKNLVQIISEVILVTKAIQKYWENMFYSNRENRSFVFFPYKWSPVGEYHRLA